MEDAKQRTSGLYGEIPIDSKNKLVKVCDEPVTNLDMQKEDLKEFLMHRIAELKNAEE